MANYIIRRLIYSVITLLLLSLTIFLIVRATGDPARILAGAEATPEEIAQIRTDLGLDRSLVAQYGSFMNDLLHGDFGRSFNFRAPVLDVYMDRLPRSLQLGTAAFLLSLIIGIPAGVLAAVRPHFWLTKIMKGISLTGVSVPNFVIATTMIYLFSVRLGGYRRRARAAGSTSSCRPSRSAGTSRRRPCASCSRRCWRSWAAST